MQTLCLHLYLYLSFRILFFFIKIVFLIFHTEIIPLVPLIILTPLSPHH